MLSRWRTLEQQPTLRLGSCLVPWSFRSMRQRARACSGRNGRWPGPGGQPGPEVGHDKRAPMRECLHGTSASGHAPERQHYDVSCGEQPVTSSLDTRSRRKVTRSRLAREHTEFARCRGSSHCPVTVRWAECGQGARRTPRAGHRRPCTAALCRKTRISWARHQRQGENAASTRTGGPIGPCGMTALLRGMAPSVASSLNADVSGRLRDRTPNQLPSCANVVGEYPLVRQDVVGGPHQMHTEQSRGTQPRIEPALSNPSQQLETLGARKTEREDPMQMHQPRSSKASSREFEGRSTKLSVCDGVSRPR